MLTIIMISLTLRVDTNAVQIIGKFLPIIFFLLTTIFALQKDNNLNLFQYMDIGKLGN